MYCAYCCGTKLAQKSVNANDQFTCFVEENNKQENKKTKYFNDFLSRYTSLLNGRCNRIELTNRTGNHAMEMFVNALRTNICELCGLFDSIASIVKWRQVFSQIYTNRQTDRWTDTKTHTKYSFNWVIHINKHIRSPMLRMQPMNGMNSVAANWPIVESILWICRASWYSTLPKPNFYASANARFPINRSSQYLKSTTKKKK